MRLEPLDWTRDAARIRSLLLERPLSPYRAYSSQLDPRASERLSLERARRQIESGPATLATTDGGTILGLCSWNRLEWDSQQFGFSAAALTLVLAARNAEVRTIKLRLLDRAIEECRAAGIRHLVARVEAGDLTSIHALETRGFQMIDGIQTFSLQLDGLAPEDGVRPFAVRPFEEQDLAQVLEIARTSYVYDRFHADDALAPETADRVNETWLRESCRGNAAEAVLVAADSGRVLGYVTCRRDKEAAAALGVGFGSIVMVATHQDARGRGVARATTFAALGWFRERNVPVVEVGTQLRNLSAARLYASVGFRPVAVALTFRKRL